MTTNLSIETNRKLADALRELARAWNAAADVEFRQLAAMRELACFSPDLMQQGEIAFNHARAVALQLEVGARKLDGDS